MNKIAVIALLLLAGCAGSAPKKEEGAKIPKAMLPNNGMTDAKAKGFGDSSKFMK